MFKISIDQEKKLHKISEEFTHRYPFLKLEFYKKDKDESHPSTKKIRVLDGLTVGECSNFHSSGSISLFPEMSVADLEGVFWSNFGLSVLVLRKAGNIWLKTTHTDDWSLQEQNKQGEVVSSNLRESNSKRSN